MNTLNINQTISRPPINSNALIPSQTSSLKMKPILQKRVTFRCSIASNLTYIAKYRPKMLSTIELISLQSSQPNFKSIKTICKALKDAKKASSLIIRKDDSRLQSLKQLKHLFNNAHLRWKKLVVLYISSDGDEHPLDKEAAEIATRLRRYQDLLYLDVYLCCTQDLKNHILAHLLQQLRGLKSLQTLRLDLTGCKDREELPEDYEPNVLIFTFKFTRSLKYLQLDLEKTDFLNQKMLSTFATNLSRCNSLLHFNLQCELNNSGPLDIKILAPLFERIQSLKSFKTIQLFPPHLQFQESINFVKSLEYLKNLTKLDLFVFFFPEDAPTVFAKNLFKYLASLTNLRSLTLTLYMEKFFSDDDDPDEQNIFLLLQSLTNLQTFHLCLQCDKGKKLPGLHSLYQAVQSLNCLENFRLFFPCRKVHRSHLISLAQMLKSLTSLQTLVLLFDDADLESLDLLYSGISRLKLSRFFFDVRYKNLDLPRQQKNTFLWKHQKGLTPFFSTIGRLTSLLAFSLNLSVFDTLTKELIGLSLELKKMTQLRCLRLELPQSPSAQNFKGLRNLMSTIKEMSNLRYLQLIFKGDKLCDEEVELVASNLAECSRSLKRLELRFHEAKGLRHKSVIALQKAFTTLFSLRNLTLVFGPKNIFNEETVFGLFEALSFLKSLEALTLELPSEVVPMDFSDILKKFSGHWNLNTLTVNQTSCLQSVDQNQNQH